MRTRVDCRAALWAGALLLCGASGCDWGPPRPADPTAAREALNRALTAWKTGKSVDSLIEASPPIVVNDFAWSNGAQLIKYEVGQDERTVGADRSFNIVLWLKDKSGEEKEEKTEYRVGTAPILTVVRSGFH